MTPFQYHFPYFIDHSKFNTELTPFHWTANVIHSVSKKDPDDMILLRKINRSESNETVQIEFGTFLMVQGHRLYAWKRYEDGLLISQFMLMDENPQSTMLSEFIEIETLHVGTQAIKTKLRYDHFVTYIRKPNLEVKEDFHERYVIVILHEDQATIIPFDSFNETGGDPLYMWPALATLNLDTGMLYGHGMRMGSFEEQLDKRVFRE